MIDSPLYVAFLWHMHQPYYKNPITGIYRLPWVRLHGTKDYLDMVKTLEKYPSIKSTFNLVPSLLEQIKDYTENKAVDIYLEATLKEASSLTEADRIFILENFFLANWENMIKPFPRYYELLAKRGFRLIKSDLRRISKYFSEEEIRDLQALFNLCWIDPMFRNEDASLKELVKKGKGYTEEDKKIIIGKQFEILRQIIPVYKNLMEKNQIELSVSPFYHPILPLLWDTNSSKIAMPHVRLPNKRFSHPEDAIKQIRSSIDYFEKTFGRRPAGMWPSEGSVSEDVLKALRDEGIKWTASDENVLACSIEKNLRDSSGNITEPSVLYYPYNFSDVAIIFRDHKLSDLVGFSYSNWDSKNAADDLVNRLLNIRNSLPMPDSSPFLVSIILDGENAWEHYKNDGQDFFCCLYERLSNEERLKTTTIAEFIEKFGKGREIKKLHAGSWINSNFGVWIGNDEDNLAWDYLSETHDNLTAFEKQNRNAPVEDAWKAIYIAEGSDWNWWYGDEHTTENEEDFDELFRLNLIKVYKTIGKETPPHLLAPVFRENRTVSPEITIRGFITPKIDGIVTNYYEWYQGAYLVVEKTGGSMHKSESLISHIFYGFNEETLFLRLDPKTTFDDFPPDIVFSVDIVGHSHFRINITKEGRLLTAELHKKTDSAWEKIKNLNEAAMQDILETAVSFADIDAKEKDELNIFVSIMKNGEEIERYPWRGFISITVPTPDFEAMMWY